MSLLAKIKKNRDGFKAGKQNYVPLHDDFGILRDFYPGTMRGEYVGITGGTSSAKSQLTRRIYLFGAIEWAIRNKVNLKVLWFGLEESVEEAKYYLLSWLLFKTYGIRYNIEHFEAVGKTVFESDMARIEEIQPLFDRFWSYIHFYDTVYTNTEIHDTVYRFAEGRGTFINGGVPVVGVTGKTSFDEYKPDDPEEFVLVVVDHYGILEPSDGESGERSSMVRMSKIMRQHICKKLNYIGVGVLQQMLAMESLEHIKAEAVYASIQGIGDAKTVARDMMTLIATTNIHRYGLPTAITSQKEIDKGKINIKDTGLDDAQRVIGILKRRWGPVNKRYLLLFDGCVGYFKGISQISDVTDFVHKMASYSDGDKKTGSAEYFDGKTKSSFL